MIGVGQESISGRNLEDRHGVITQGIQKMPGTGTKVDHNNARAFLRREQQPEEKFSRARTVFSPRFLYYLPLMEKRYLAM